MTPSFVLYQSENANNDVCKFSCVSVFSLQFPHSHTTIECYYALHILSFFFLCNAYSFTKNPLSNSITSSSTKLHFLVLNLSLPQVILFFFLQSLVFLLNFIDKENPYNIVGQVFVFLFVCIQVRIDQMKSLVLAMFMKQPTINFLILLFTWEFCCVWNFFYAYIMLSSNIIFLVDYQRD